MKTIMTSSFDELRAERLRKLELLQAADVDPYPADSHRTHSIAEFLANFSEFEENKKTVTISGRMRSRRLHGGSAFTDLFDGSGTLQAYLKKDETGEASFALFMDATDTGDFIEVTGTAFTTHKGQQSLLATSWRMLAKSLRAVPDAWFGLKDEDERYRRRYLDMLLNDSVADIVRKRSLFWNAIRSYLLEQDFLEVETPVLENTTGGADARPFRTHHHALDIELFLRISAGELWQKKLLVAGFPKVFEIGRIFRNEGMSREHLQDYTQLEFYMAYTDYRKGMFLIQDLYRTLALKVFGRTKFEIFDHTVDLASEWKEYHFCEILKEHFGVDPLATTLPALEDALSRAEITYDPNTLNIERGVDLLWKKVRKTIAGPGFLIGIPVYLEPLAKRAREDDRLVERFQVLIAGSEVGKGFSELNDPLDQRARFMHQQSLRDAGDEEAQMADMDFVEALEYGMPPAFGFGVSERLFSFLAGIDVREGQLFPLMRPKIPEHE